MHGKAVNCRRRGDNCRTRSDIKKSRNNAEKTFLCAYLLSLNVIPNKKTSGALCFCFCHWNEVVYRDSNYSEVISLGRSPKDLHVIFSTLTSHTFTLRTAGSLYLNS